MIRIRKREERGHANHGWLDASHTFSFADYYDPEFTSFRSLRVMNEDRVQPGMGFGTHGHRDMEILTFVLSGALEHKDSTGGGEILRPGEVQRMTAGRGIRHSEMNPSATEPVHLYQVWLLPEREGLDPGYEQKAFPDEAREDRLCLVASRDARDGSLTIHQDADVYVATLAGGGELAHDLREGRHAWLQVARGEVELGGQRLRTSDGAMVTAEASIGIRAIADAEFLLFDLA